MGSGFFGKLPSAGDFVARGMPPGVRGPLDAWLSAHLVDIARGACGWPEGGVRIVLQLGASDWIILVEPSGDAVGRSYPLCVLVPLSGTDRAGADGWADGVWPLLLRAADGECDADTLADALRNTALPPAAGEALKPAVMWWAGQRADAPQVLLPQLAQISSC
ncbi:type VI secretion system-associated protein TagF [Sulfitobacter sp. HNIBRBA3233]|uniref:type VI secretion system-associated protein TagF n=1 Tax=Sulfitobacter marinivivus TaxID=3158558 RepID=UPI0032DF526D